jgi:hypothetical protein
MLDCARALFIGDGRNHGEGTNPSRQLVLRRLQVEFFQKLLHGQPVMSGDTFEDA